MFQKGTGERFKYKQAVLEIFPDAVCKRTPIKGYIGREYSSYYYAVSVKDKRISETFRRAEDAWVNVWIKYIKDQL